MLPTVDFQQQQDHIRWNGQSGTMSSTANQQTQQRIPAETAKKIEDLCFELYPSGRMGDERRNETRYPFPYLVMLSPVEDDGLTPLVEPFSVVCKEISEGGLGFYYQEPMPYRYVVASLPALVDRPAIHLLVDLTWCRIARKGWYENGGQFVREMEEPALVTLVEAKENGL